MEKNLTVNQLFIYCLEDLMITAVAALKFLIVQV
jgi:hypothetical protein